MTRKILHVIALLLSATLLANAQSTTDAAGNSATERHSVRPDADAKALKTDLEKMHVLLEQMQRNVAFVSSGDTPLKHQFQLEIEMWQLLIRDMEQKTGVQQSR